MAKTPEEALDDSSRQFRRLLEPRLEKVLRGQFEIVEAVTGNEMTQRLDMLAGIDLWWYNTERGIRGVANRIQTTGHNWRTFTVRKDRASGARTEFAKREHAIEHDYLYPILTLQAYVTESGNRLLGFGIAETKDIIAAIGSGLYYTNHTGADQIGQASFYVVGWDVMRRAGYIVYEENHETGEQYCEDALSTKTVPLASAQATLDFEL